jgi:hypothetical protein
LEKFFFGTNSFLQPGRFPAELVIVLRQAVQIREQTHLRETPVSTMFLTRQTMFSVRPAFRKTMLTELIRRQIFSDLMNKLRRENLLLT